MEQHEIEQIVGRLYLALVERENQITELKAQIPKPPPTIFSMATPRDAEPEA